MTIRIERERQSGERGVRGREECNGNEER